MSESISGQVLEMHGGWMSQHRDAHGRWVSSGSRTWNPDHAKTGDDAQNSLVASRPALNSEQAQRVRYYTGDGFSQMNRRLRSGSQDTADKRGTDALRGIIGRSKVQHDMVLLHGRANLGDVGPGDDIHERGFLSSTTDSSVAKNYAGVGKGAAILRVRLKKGQKALSTRGLSDNPAEKEVLLPDDQHYRVLKVQQVKGLFGQPVRLVDVEVHQPAGGAPMRSSDMSISDQVGLDALPPVPDDPTAVSMFTAHRINDIGTELTHARDHIRIMRKADPSLRHEHGLHFDNHLKTAMDHAGRLKDNMLAHYPAEAEEWRRLAHVMNLSNQVVALASGYTLNKRSGMISLDLPPRTIAPVPGGVDGHHVTVVYLGPDVDDDAFAEACRRAQAAASGVPGPLTGSVGGIGTFPPSKGSDAKKVAWAGVMLPGAEQLRSALEDLSASEHKDWKTHVTLAYLDPDEPLPAPVPQTPVTITHLSVHRGGDVVRFPLGGGPAEMSNISGQISVDLAKSVSPAAKAASFAHLLQTIMYDGAHAAQHSTAMLGDTDDRIWNFDADHAEKHTDGALEHCHKLVDHILDNYPAEARLIRSPAGRESNLSAVFDDSITGQILELHNGWMFQPRDEHGKWTKGHIGGYAKELIGTGKMPGEGRKPGALESRLKDRLSPADKVWRNPDTIGKLSDNDLESAREGLLKQHEKMGAWGPESDRMDAVRGKVQDELHNRRMAGFDAAHFATSSTGPEYASRESLEAVVRETERRAREQGVDPDLIEGHRAARVELNWRVMKNPAKWNAHDHLRIFGGTPEHQKRTETAMARLTADVPPEKSFDLKHVDITDRNMQHDSRFSVEDVEGLYYPGDKHMEINPRVMDKGSSSLESEASGWYSKSGHPTTLDRTLDHEFGHHLDYELTPDERNKLFTHLTGVIGRTKYVAMPQANQQHFVADNKAEIVNHVGTYAATNDKELLAELWAEYHGKKIAGTPSADQYKSSQVVGRYLVGHNTPYNPEAS